MIEFPFNNISDAVFYHALRTPGALALQAGEDRLDWGTLADAVARAARFLSGCGLKPGERIGIGLGNVSERIILGLAAMHMGLVVVELPVGLNDTVLPARVRQLGLAASIVPPGGAASPARVALQIGPGWRASLAAYPPLPPAALPPEQFQLIVLSSGSTGQPKAALVSHAQRILRASLYLSRFGEDWTAQTPLLMLAPAATSLISQCLATQILLGGASILLPPFTMAPDMARAIAAFENAICPLPPGLIRPLISLGVPGRPLLPHLRALISSGQPMGAHDKLAVLANVSPRFHEVYGASGFGLIAHAGPAMLAARPGSVGRPISGPGIAVEIVSPAREPVPPGQRGILRLRGPNAASGYLNPEDHPRSPEYFAEGWYYPGEIASLDADGCLILHGRAAEAMRIGGDVLYPPEIEDAITRHPHIAEAAITACAGVAGDEIIAFIVPGPGFTQAAFASHCQAALPPARQPARIILRNALPRTGNGKLDRPALKALAEKPAEEMVE
jgi:acyl-coenzyme A synthetase/AMP-(fatty) acid ligase